MCCINAVEVQGQEKGGREQETVINQISAINNVGRCSLRSLDVNVSVFNAVKLVLLHYLRSVARLVVIIYW